MRMRLVACILLLAAVAGRGEVVFPRDKAAHVVASPQTTLEQRLVGRLTGYLSRVLRQPPVILASLEQAPPGTPIILLSSKESPIPLPISLPADSPESYGLVTTESRGHAVVAAVGATDRGLKRAIQRLIIESRQEPSLLVIADMKRTESPWIPHREWTVCPWTPLFVRGVFVNPQADRRMDITRYGEEQLADYAEMFDWFGYSGCQLIETCYSYGVFGSAEGFQSWQKRLATAVRSNGQEVSLWVWSAEFSGFNWYDPEVVAVRFPARGAFDDPPTRRIFEKYYDHYARLAPLVDRVLGHFYDPGRLQDRADVFKYMRLLEQKFKAVNPKVEMGIDFWAAGPEYLQQLVDNGFKDYLLLENGMPLVNPPGVREKLHKQAREKGLKLGIWGWYLTEYETDQMASMYVNTEVLKSVYQQIKKDGTDVYPVGYWSEMEAHHLNNIYSMYVAGQLLWNPDRDPHEILKELVFGIWGPDNGPEVLKALQLIQDVRSGPNWETYWWGTPQYRIGTDRPAEDLKRADAALAALAGMKADLGFVPKFPLPFGPQTFVELMIPHLRQIKCYSEFRLKLEEIRKAAKEGASKDALQKMLDDAFVPIPEFNTWIGTFDTPEIRQQERQARALCEELKLTLKYPAWFRYLEADRAYQVIQSRQRATTQPYRFAPSAINEFIWDKAKLNDRVSDLLQEGLIEKVEGDRYRLRR
jgi:hypothetical protein